MNFYSAIVGISSGNECVNIKLIRKIDELEDGAKGFKPIMCHQVFGESESIFGYKNLKINIFYSARQFHCYVNFTYDEKVDESADDFMKSLQPWLPSDFVKSKKEFVRLVSKEKDFVPFGKLITAFKSQDRCFEIYYCKLDDDEFKDFLKRLQTLIVWYIDGASFIDVEDKQWRCYIVYEKVEIGDKSVYYPVGYCTTYWYYSFPNGHRVRISQFIIFPPFQKIGIGTTLLKSIYDHLATEDSIVDITVEIPSANFQAIRDYVDAKQCISLPSFSIDTIKKGYSKKMASEAKRVCKINEKQCQRIYEILRLFHIDSEKTSEYETYKHDVLKRLDSQFKKQENNMRGGKYLKTKSSPTPYQNQHRNKLVENEFEELLAAYKKQTVIDSVSTDDPDFEGDGYTSLAIVYIVLAVCNWLVPSVISITGPRIGMVIGAVTYLLFIMNFLLPLTWLLYLASVIVGIGASIIWTSQGNYLTLNSDSLTISRNSGIFWAMLQCSMFFGNIYVYFQFQGLTHIDEHTRTIVFWVLAAIAAVGIIFLILLRAVPEVEGTPRQAVEGPWTALKHAAKLILTKKMLLLSVTFFYTGLELGFYSGVYSASVGFTNKFGDQAKQLVGLSGILIGAGEVIGGALFGILGAKTIRWGRDPIVIAGFFIHIVAFFLIFLNLPNESPLGGTDDNAFITSSAPLAIFCSFLLGLADSCYNTQIYSILGNVFADQSVPAFAIFKFSQSLAAAIAFFYASHAGLFIQLAILVVFGTCGTVTFCIVEWIGRKEKRKLQNGNEESE